MPKNKGKKIVQSEDPFAICVVSIAPMRARPAHAEEQVSQLLWGEQAEILDRKGKHWLKIRSSWDRCVGWVETYQVFRIAQKEYELNNKKQAFALELVQGVMGKEQSIPIVLGSTLPRFDGMTLRMPLGKMTYSGQAIFSDTLEMNNDRLVKLGLKYIHAPFQHGGRSPFGMDGPGLIQMIFKIAGLTLPRYAEHQVNYGDLVNFPSDAQVADLAFFEDTKGKIIHVGMITEPNRILHAFGQVRIDYFDHHGIFNEVLGKYTHRLRVIKRLQVRNQPLTTRDSSIISQ